MSKTVSVVTPKNSHQNPAPPQPRKENTPRFAIVAMLVFLVCFAQVLHAQNPAPALTTPGQYLQITDTKIYYEECGSGPAVVLLHDGLLHSNTWDGAWPALCKKYHAIRYDRRGYGHSEQPKTRFTPTEDLFALLNHLNVRHAIIVGNSSGGALAIDFALAHPQMVEGLFLVGPVVGGMDTTDHFNQRGAQNSAPIAKGDLKAAAENWSRDHYIVATGHDAARKIILDTLLQYPQNLTNSHQLETQNTMPALYRLSQIHAPTAILVGEFDIPDVHAQSGAIEAGIPGAQRDILNNAGHLIQVEAPAAFVEKLGEFVDLQERQGIAVPAALLQSYAGKYGAGPFEMTITLQDGQLMLQTPGVPPLPMFAESQTKFFMKNFQVEVEFTKDATGKITQATIYQAGDSFKLDRL
jgi:3-oxoadipate enol-lactonase